ncbi:serine/threonine-protein phosphatase 7 long form-like protein, partial [Trifolium medium]|nr:serine/threonine-protein phosphatase 7 long form-like protein [Trifolium medium]
MLVVNQAQKDGDKDTFERYKGYIMRVYLLLLVGTTIFSNKAKNNVDMTYLKYFRELDQAWIYDHFVDTGGYLDDEYIKEYPGATKYDPTKGQSTQLAMRKMMDQLLPHDITWTPYEDHRDVCPMRILLCTPVGSGVGPSKS